MTQANAHQVGGSHYKTTYEHWDLVLRVGMGYFEGQATKYVARWRKKNGSQDLEKALHFIQKLQESAYLIPQPRKLAVHKAVVHAEAGYFARANGLTPAEEGVVATIAAWQYVMELCDVPDQIRALWRSALWSAREEVVVPVARPVPLTEENHYADRAQAGDPARGGDPGDQAGPGQAG